MNKDIIDMYACPFCHLENSCGINNSSPCWCTQQKVPPALIDLVPEHIKNKACICNNCISQYNNSPQDFKDQWRETLLQLNVNE